MLQFLWYFGKIWAKVLSCVRGGSANSALICVFRLLMEELVNSIERVPKAQSASMWKNKEVQR